jgi:hypothetical protein
MIKIYGLFEPETDEIRYVGQTYRHLEIRLKEHLQDCVRRPRSCHKINWLNKLLSENKIPDIKLIEKVQMENAVEREKFWISKLISEGHKLTNSTEGGEFCTFGSKLSQDVREHMSKIAKERSNGENNTMWGKKHKDSSKKKMSDKKKGIYVGVYNPRSREIFEYDDSNNLLRKWSHCKECADHHHISRGNLSTFAKHNTMIENENKSIKYKKLKGLIFKFI